MPALQQKFDDPSAVRRSHQRRAGQRVRPCGCPRRTTRHGSGADSGARDPGIRSAKIPDNLVGILYPLMGPAIRKSIAENLDGTLQRLNQAFKHSFSWQGLKWRLEAFRSGSSFADVVLKHTVRVPRRARLPDSPQDRTSPRTRCGGGSGDAGSPAWSPEC